MQNFKFKNLQIKNFEMETSALYYLGRTLGHNTLTICAVIEIVYQKYSENYCFTINKMIDIVLKNLFTELLNYVSFLFNTINYCLWCITSLLCFNINKH